MINLEEINDIITSKKKEIENRLMDCRIEAYEKNTSEYVKIKCLYSQDEILNELWNDIVNQAHANAPKEAI